jgi:hypothetical protein
VVSVHRQAVNVLLDSGPVVALLGDARPVHPWAICVPFIPRGLVEGSPAEPISASTADSAAEWRVGPITVLLHEMKIEDLQLHDRPRAFATDLLLRLQRWQEASRPQDPTRRNNRAPDDSPFTGVLIAAVDAFRAGGDPRRLAVVLGLGEGLTPSGDDILVGVLAGLDLALDAWPAALQLRRSLVEAIEETIGEAGAGPLANPAPQRTPRLSAQMLRAAIAGLYTEPVLGVLQALRGTGPDEEPVTNLLNMGHRSGADTLHGIIAVIDRATNGRIA